jgi:hypothetical protein
MSTFFCFIYFVEYLLSFKKHITARSFRFRKCENNMVKMEYKTYSKEVEWKEVIFYIFSFYCIFTAEFISSVIFVSFFIYFN